MLINANDAHAVEPVRVVDQHPLALGQHGVVRGAPRDRERIGDPSHGQVLHHQALQRPPQPASGQLRPRLGRRAGVLAPHVPAAGAAVAADRDQQRRRPPSERLVCKPSGDRVAQLALAAAPTTPVIWLDNTARQHGPISFKALAGHRQAELGQATEGSQISAVEPSIRFSADGSVRHVEVFRMRRVGTFILGRPRPLSPHRRAGIYTLIWEEPLSAVRSCRPA